MDQTCPNWNTFVQNGSNLSKIDQTCPKWIKLVQNESNLSKLAQIFHNWTKFVLKMYSGSVGLKGFLVLFKIKAKMA